jgi:hypothetical protein
MDGRDGEAQWLMLGAGFGPWSSSCGELRCFGVQVIVSGINMS